MHEASCLGQDMGWVRGEGILPGLLTQDVGKGIDGLVCGLVFCLVSGEDNGEDISIH